MQSNFVGIDSQKSLTVCSYIKTNLLTTIFHGIYDSSCMHNIQFTTDRAIERYGIEHETRTDWTRNCLSSTMFVCFWPKRKSNQILISVSVHELSEIEHVNRIHWSRTVIIRVSEHYLPWVPWLRDYILSMADFDMKITQNRTEYGD